MSASKPSSQNNPTVDPQTSVADATSSSLQMEVLQALPTSSKTIGSWRSLAANPMASPDWLMPWWENYSSSDDTLQLVAFTNQDELVALAPLYLENGRDFKLLGSGKVCSDHSELLIGESTWVNQAESQLLDWLASDQAPQWRSLQLEAIDSDSQTVKIADQWSSQLSVSNQPGEPICAIELPEDWDQYLKSLSKNHRKRVRRWLRQHVESDQIQRRSTASGWNLEEAYECLIHLHNLRRSELPDKGAFECEQFLNFHKDAFYRLAQQDQAAISAIFIDERPIAIEYELTNQDSVFAYQSGVDINSGELSSPGSISVLLRLQSAITSGKKTFDLMRGDEDYKSHWKADRAITRNITMWPRNRAGNIARLKHHTKRALRSTARSAKGYAKGLLKKFRKA